MKLNLKNRNGIAIPNGMLQSLKYNFKYFIVISTLFMMNASFAATANKDDKTWGGLYTTLNSLFTGTPAAVASLAALIIGLLFALFTDHKVKAIVGGIGIPIAIQVGPAVFVGLSGALI